MLSVYLQERIFEDIVEYTEELLRQNGAKDRAEMYRQFIAMFEPHGVVDIALDARPFN